MTKTNPHIFLKHILKELNDIGVELRNWEIDHLCYRTSSEEHYQQTKDYFEKQGRLLVESEVGGRMIATYKLSEPIAHEGYLVDLVEVPAPKPGRKTQEGYEHIEVVIDQDFASFMQQHSQINFNTKGLIKELNPELEIEFDDVAVKFHHKSLEHIINIEKNSRVMGFLESSQILSEFKNFSPCLSGSLPLDIHTIDSDLDIIMCSPDLDQFEQRAQDYFSSQLDFQIKRKVHQALDSSIVNFVSNDLSIELFCCNKDVFLQQANQHLLIEGRILKVAPGQFKEELMKLKNEGVKTEPAFGKLLNLSNPYLDLLQLSKHTDLELRNKFFN